MGSECRQRTHIASDIRFLTSVYLIIGGPTGSGKITFCIRFLQNLDTPCTEPDFPGVIIWCYSEQSAMPQQQLAALRINVQFTRLYTKILKTQCLPCLFILDDLLNEVFSRAVCDLFTKGSHQKFRCNYNYPELFSPSSTLP